LVILTVPFAHLLLLLAWFHSRWIESGWQSLEWNEGARRPPLSPLFVHPFKRWKCPTISPTDFT
jgi:hypothetical protein